MYQKVLVPLDGSELAECSLPQIINLAKEGALGEVILLHVAVLELPWQSINLDDTGLGNRFDFNALRNSNLEKAKTYLTGVQSRLAAAGLQAQIVTLEADRPAAAVLDYAREQGVDLLVLATHGYSGMKKMLLGSVAFKILHESPVPVLLVRPESCRPW